MDRYPYRDLFMWALVNGMHKMAMFFWEFEDEGLIKALIGVAVNKELAKKASRLSNSQDEIKMKYLCHARSVILINSPFINVYCDYGLQACQIWFY